MTMPKDCPAGFYCPEGTQPAVQNPCPIGTFSNTSALTNESQCTVYNRLTTVRHRALLNLLEFVSLDIIAQVEPQIQTRHPMVELSHRALNVWLHHQTLSAVQKAPMVVPHNSQP